MQCLTFSAGGYLKGTALERPLQIILSIESIYGWIDGV
uniref:Uncharacterized protein n=1 Tax=Rhizophora mucronata TaxID=61149 RepID=A0A2P2Q484_RHIMU